MKVTDFDRSGSFGIHQRVQKRFTDIHVVTERELSITDSVRNGVGHTHENSLESSRKLFQPPTNIYAEVTHSKRETYSNEDEN